MIDVQRVFGTKPEGLNPSNTERWQDGWVEHDEVYGPARITDPFNKTS